MVGDERLVSTGEEVLVALMLAAVFNAVSIVFVSWFQASGGRPGNADDPRHCVAVLPAVYFGNMWFGLGA